MLPPSVSKKKDQKRRRLRRHNRKMRNTRTADAVHGHTAIPSTPYYSPSGRDACRARICIHSAWTVKRRRRKNIKQTGVFPRALFNVLNPIKWPQGTDNGNGTSSRTQCGCQSQPQLRGISSEVAAPNEGGKHYSWQYWCTYQSGVCFNLTITINKSM